MATTAKRDYYSVLGVSRTASEKDIKSAYRRLARKHHPDVNPGDKKAEANFKEIGGAYAVLSDPDKRKKYDRWGPDWERIEQAQAAGGPFGGGAYTRTTSAGNRPGGAPGGGSFTVEGDDLGDLFEQLFGQAASGRGPGGRVHTRVNPRKGQDIEQTVDVTLEEAFNGTQRTFQILDRQTGELKGVEVKIPAGAYEGLKVRVAGKGQPGANGGQAGDLYLVVHVLAHAQFEREGDDLRVKVPVPLYTAVLGGEVLVPTLKGSQLALKVAPETQTGQRIRLTGQGMPRVTGEGRGDLFAEAQVQVPRSLTDREKELFRELAGLRASSPSQARAER